MKLKNLLVNKIEQRKASKEEKIDFQDLDQYLPYIFQIDEDTISRDMRKLNVKHKDEHVKHHNMSQYDMQFHTEDQEWMQSYVKYVVDFIKHFRECSDLSPLHNSNRAEFPASLIKKYVEKSPNFKQKHDEYAQELVKAFIKMHLKVKSDFSCTPEQMEEERKDKFYDIKFRDQVVKAMKSLGVSHQNIEKGIELNQDLWLPVTRKQAFKNCKGEGIVGEERRLLNIVDPDALLVLDNSEKALFKNWNDLRDVDYYWLNKKTIDELGTKKPIMEVKGMKKNQLIKTVNKLANNYDYFLKNCYKSLKGTSSPEFEELIKL